MTTTEADPADGLARSLGVARELLAWTLAWGLCWLFVTGTLGVDAGGVAGFLWMASPIGAAVLTVFGRRALGSARAVA